MLKLFIATCSLVIALIVIASGGAAAPNAAPAVTVDQVTDHSLTYENLKCGTTYRATFAEQRADGTYTKTTTKTNTTSACASPPPPPPPLAAACADGLDNDADGKTDYPADPGCTNASDTDETESAARLPTGTNCFASPGACGFPDPAFNNVGVPSGTTLTPSGSLTVNTAGAVIDGLDVSGTIDVNAPNVTIKNTRVTVTGPGCGASTCGNAAIYVNGAYTVTISHVELTANAPTTVEHAIRNTHGGTINVDHVYQHGNTDALCNCGNGSVRDTYSMIHLAIADDHLENIYTDDGTMSIVHNTFFNTAMQTTNIFGNTHNGSGGACENHLTIDSNLFGGAGFTLDLCAHGTVGTSTAQITNNRFTRCRTPEQQGGGGTWLCANGPDQYGYFPNGGSFGRSADVYCSSPGWAWSGNVWDDSNTAIAC